MDIALREQTRRATPREADMGRAVEDLLRLAWQVDAEGKPGMRDALLTLAVAESGVDDAVLAERCRRLLVAHRPDHWFATTAPLSQALTHSKVVGNLAKLRMMFPPVRVQWMLMRAAVQTGPYTGSAPSLAQILSDLAPGGRDEHVVVRSLPFPGLRRRVETVDDVPETIDPEGSVTAMYLTVLLAMAVLLKGVLEPATSRDNRAA